MQTELNDGPGWAVLTVWVVVNAVNALQALGFLSRVRTHSQTINHRLGYGMMALAVPAGLAMISFLRAGAGGLYWLGPAIYVTFVILMIGVDYVWPVEFRSPRRLEILAPYLALFFGSILLMGLPMFQIDRRLWLVTVTTSLFLLVSMGIAMRKGVG